MLSLPQPHGVLMAKFMLSLRDENFHLLTTEAEQRGISIQELIRAVIIPDWVKQTSFLKLSSNNRSIPGNGNGRDTITPLPRFRKPSNGNYSTQL